MSDVFRNILLAIRMKGMQIRLQRLMKLEIRILFCGTVESENNL